MTQAESARKTRQKPGTYRYMEAHGLGTAGTLKRLRDNRRIRAIAEARDAGLLVELQKRIGEFNASTRNA